MARTRILLALSGLRRDIVQRLVAAEDDMEVVGAIDESAPLLAAVERTGAELVVLGVGRGGVPPECDELLYTHCDARVLALEGNADSGFLYQLLPGKVPLGELGPERLIEAIRRPAAARAAH